MTIPLGEITVPLGDMTTNLLAISKFSRLIKIICLIEILLYVCCLNYLSNLLFS
jgi:hypothetical protein